MRVDALVNPLSETLVNIRNLVTNRFRVKTKRPIMIYGFVMNRNLYGFVQGCIPYQGDQFVLSGI